MASWICRATKTITTCTKNINVTNSGITIGLLTPQTVLLQNARNTSFFAKRPAAQLWKAVTSVSNAGKKRGRAKILPKSKNLNKGQTIGVGKVQMIFPGLNSIFAEDLSINIRRGAQEEHKAHKSLTISADEIVVKPKKTKRVHPLNRGWSGGHVGGRPAGPPDPVEGDTFDGFESWILRCHKVQLMSGILGRVKRFHSLVITGNRNGLVGFSSVTGNTAVPSIITARNRAGLRIFHVKRYNDHTVLHDFYTQFGKTKIFVTQKPKGYGLRCHRVIKTCCEAAGIKDLYAKIEGSKNVFYIVTAFFIGLLRQKTPEEMANEKKLHLVEIRKENNYFPTVVASPAVARNSKQILPNEILNFRQYAMDGRIPLQRAKSSPFYTKLPSWQNHLRKEERHRGQFDVRIRLRAQYDDLCSFLAEKYPEARAAKWRKHDRKEEE